MKVWTPVLIFVASAKLNGFCDDIPSRKNPFHCVRQAAFRAKMAAAARARLRKAKAAGKKAL
jgi:hypothetical protein